MLKAHIVLYFLATLVAVDAFYDLFRHVNEWMFSPLLAIAVSVALIGKYSAYRNRNRSNGHTRG